MRTVLGAAALVATLALPVPGAAGAGPTPPVRPGAAYTVDGGRCTFAFLLKGSDRRIYAATAGHCVPVAKPTSWAADRGPVIVSAGRLAGHARYSVFSSNDRDFALLQLAKGVAYSPAVCHWGGPQALQTTPSSTPVVAEYFGQGEIPRTVAPARQGVFTALPDQRYVRFAGVADNGDSGSPVLDAQGNAVGVLTSINPDADGLIGVNRLEPHLRDAERALRIRLTLMTTSAVSEC